MACLFHKADLMHKAHLIDGRLLGRINAAILLGLVGGGLAACVIGAAAYDVARVFSAW
jgi:hypothetical protein